MAFYRDFQRVSPFRFSIIQAIAGRSKAPSKRGGAHGAIGFAIAILYFCVASSLFAVEPLRVACVGDSITFGAGLKDRAHNAWPVRLGAWMGDGYEVRNFGVSGTTVLKN